MDYLENFIASYKGHIEELAVEHATNPLDSEELIERLGKYHPKDHIYRSTVSPLSAFMPVRVLLPYRCWKTRANRNFRFTLIFF